MQQVSSHKEHLEQRLSLLKAQGLIDKYEVSRDKVSGYFQVAINGKGFNVRLYADFRETMEIVINGYYREITDYLIGDYSDTIEWYLAIIKNIATKKYVVTEYLRNGKVVCKYLNMNVRGKPLRIGDHKNHFVLFAKKIERGSEGL